MSRAFRLALFDDDSERRQTFACYFSSHGFVVSELEHGPRVIENLTRKTCHLIIAYTSRDANEVSLLNEVRRAGLRCMIVNDRSDLVDRVIALELGADDYLDQSVDRRELLARVRVVLRAEAGDARATPSAASELAANPSIRLDRVQRCLVHNGSTTALTTAEFNLLVSLADHANISLSREVLYQLVYNRRWSALDRTLDTLIAKLRRKLEPDPEHPTLIKTVHGTGYIFTGVNFA